MQDRYVADEARVSISSLEAETIMKSTPVQTVKSILGRIGIEYEDGLPKEAYISALKEEFCSEPKWVLLMLPKVMLDFLTEVWENSVIAMTEERWNYIEYLKIFGFLANALAMATLCCSPPDKVVKFLSTKSFNPTFSKAFLAIL